MAIVIETYQFKNHRIELCRVKKVVYKLYADGHGGTRNALREVVRWEGFVDGRKVCQNQKTKAQAKRFTEREGLAIK